MVRKAAVEIARRSSGVLGSNMKVRHLPYEVNVEGNRFHFYENYWKVVGIDLLERHSKTAGKSLLDYGCGRGETIRLAWQRGLLATGTDPDPECVRLAAQYGPATLLKPDDPVGQLGAKSFDVVTCFHVLEHVENPKFILNSLREIAREHVVLAVPNLRYLHHLFARGIDLSGFNQGHLQSWDHWHLRNLAERHCGLEFVEWGFDSTVLPLVSNLSQRILGTKATIRLETGVFRRLLPFHGISVIGLFRAT